MTMGGTGDLVTFDAKVRAAFSALNVCQSNLYSKVGVKQEFPDTQI